MCLVYASVFLVVFKSVYACVRAQLHVNTLSSIARLAFYTIMIAFIITLGEIM